jgi:hypothetical protein
MRKALTLLFSLCSPIAFAQITSSGGLGCTVVAGGGMACIGPVAVPIAQNGEKKNPPELLITHFRLEPGAALDQPNRSSDCLILSINGGELVNEREPFLHVPLEKDSVTLLPREQPFRLRNKSSQSVEFRLVEVKRVTDISAVGSAESQQTMAQMNETETAWIGHFLDAMQAIKVGMTRSDLTNLFTTEGGLSTPSQHTYVYRQCPYIKVDVRFATSNPEKELPTDKIVEVSRPYLAWSVMN